MSILAGGLLIWLATSLSSALVCPAGSFDPTVFRAGATARRLMGGAIVVDVENLRGKSGFALSHWEILDSLTTWTNVCQLQGQVTLVVDHGSEPSAYWLPDRGLSVVFAGPTRKADDIIAQDVAFLGEHSDVLVVTADAGLIHRCRRSAVKKGLQILPPVSLLEDLEKILEQTTTTLDDTETNETMTSESQFSDNNDSDQTGRIAALEREIKLGAELLEAEALLKAKAGVNNKRKGKLKAKVRSLREKLSKNNHGSTSMIHLVTDVLSNGRRSKALGALAQHEQNALLERWEKVRKKSKRKERTGDRVILAEHLRRELDEQYGVSTYNLTSTGVSSSQEVLTLAMAHVIKINSKRKDIMLPSLTNSLRLVVVSDTHGFEETLTPNGETLPEGDILLHLGDFAVDNGPKKEALQNFDEWLAKQPHPTKIVVRGNHDPRTWFPVVSGATYLTRPTTISIGGFSFAFVPYVSGGLSTRMMPRRCDVLVSHVPPRNILDRTYMGSLAGCSKLRRGVERMKSGPPALWLCGHIHEGRGIMRCDFAGDRETLVVNAANANSGLARQIDHGPVVLQLSKDEQKKHEKKVQVLSMDDQFVFLNKKDDLFFQKHTSTATGVRELLVAVDLGLRTGMSIFSDEGRLLWYEAHQFKSADELRKGSTELLSKWEKDANKGDEKWAITHIAIEGGDVAVRDVWRELSSGKALLSVRPEEWRADLLSHKEKLSGDSSKEAARLIARQIVADYGGRLHEGKFNTDVAEAVLLGFHVARRLAWIERQPGVRRYTNGKIIVPKTVEDCNVVPSV